MARDTDGGTTVGDTRAEGANVASLVLASETELVVFTVDGNVLEMLLGKLLNGLFNGLHSSWLTHGLGGVVGVATSTVPVTLSEWLGVEGDLDAPLFGDADEEEASHPEVVTHGDAFAWADLELPLRRHDLGVDARDIDTGVEASAVVGLDEVAGKHLAGSDTAVVGALGTRETALWPSEWSVIGVEESVLLLETEPRDLVLCLLHDLCGMVTVVGPVGGTVVVVALCEDENVVTTTEGILEDGGGTKVDVRIVTWGLVGRRTVKVPNAEVSNILDVFRHGRRLAAKTTIAINPDVFCLDLASLIEIKVALEEFWLVSVCCGHFSRRIGRILGGRRVLAVVEGNKRLAVGPTASTRLISSGRVGRHWEISRSTCR